MSTAPHRAPQQAPHAVPRLADLAKGQVVATRDVALTRAHLVHYAGVSGDRNPIHWSDAQATAVGLPSVIAHGMLTMAAAADVVVAWLGDPGAVLDHGVRFTGLVPVPATGAAVVRITATVAVLDEAAGTARIDLTAALLGEDGEPGAAVLGRARTTVRLATP